MKVKIISRETIKPSHATPKHLQYLQASLFDHANHPVLIPLVYFYSPQNNTTTTIEAFLDRLKISLADTLCVFYPLAGRVKDKHGINCNDEGVPFVEAKVFDTRFEDIVYKADVFELDPLQPNEGQDGFSNLLLVIQVTTFRCGSLTIGLKMSHAIADGISLVMFVNTWASIAKGKDVSAFFPRPYFEIWKEFPRAKQVDQPMPNLGSIKFTKPISKRFAVSKDKLISLRTKLYPFDGTNKDNNVPSLFMILSAFIWSRVMISCRSNDSKPCIVFHAVNLRPKVKPPKQCYYFGNMVANAMIETSISQANNNNVSDTMYLCRDFLCRMNESVNKILSDGFIRKIRVGREDLRFMKEIVERVIRGEISALGFSNLRSLPAHEADFGWGKPVWVSSGSSAFKSMVYLTPVGPSSKDIEFYISLSDEEMAKLESDREFLSFVSKVSGITSKL